MKLILTALGLALVAVRSTAGDRPSFVQEAPREASLHSHASWVRASGKVPTVISTLPATFTSSLPKASHG